MALNLRVPGPEPHDAEPDHRLDPRFDGGRRLGPATSEWDDPDWEEEAGRNPAGLGGDPYLPQNGLRRWIRGGFGLLALAGFVGVLWYAYEWGLGGDDAVGLPTVQAEAGPEKIKPVDPGGLQVPYQDQLVLNEDEAAAANVERLLPPPEMPELADIAPSYDEPAGALPAQDETAGLQPAGEAVVSGAATSAATSAPAAPAAPQAAEQAAEPEAPKAETQDSQVAAQDVTPEPAKEKPAASQTAAAPATAPAAAPAEAPAAASQASGAFAVQLVSLKDRGAAQREWQRLQSVFPGLLGDKSLLLQSAEVAGVGTVYRLRAGPFASRSNAAQVCAQLKSKQQDCLVVSR